MIEPPCIIFCPIRECGCEDISCDGVLPVHTHEDYQEHQDGETRFRLVCFKSDTPYELPGSYTEEELGEFCEQYDALTKKRAGEETKDLSTTPKPKSRRKPKRGRVGSGLKGKRTERMASQLGDFKLWLATNPINERKQGCKVGERANQFWLSRQKTFERDAKRDGEKKGFGTAKALATAYRNSKH